MSKEPIVNDHDVDSWVEYNVKVLDRYGYRRTLRDRYMLRDNGGLWWSFYIQYLLDMGVDYKYIFGFFTDDEDRLETTWDICEGYSDGTVYIELSNSLMQYHYRADLKRLAPDEAPEIGHLKDQQYTAHTTLKVYTDIPYQAGKKIIYSKIKNHITSIVGNTYKNLWDYSEWWDYSRNTTIEWDPVFFVMHSTLYKEFLDIIRLVYSEKIRVCGPDFIPLKYLSFKYPEKMRYIFKLTERCSPRSKQGNILDKYSFGDIFKWISTDEWDYKSLELATEGCEGVMTFANSIMYNYLAADPYYQFRETFKYDLSQFNFSPMSYLSEHDVKDILNFINLDMTKVMRIKDSSHYMGIDYTEQHAPFQEHTFKTRIHNDCVAILGDYVVLNPISLFDLILFGYKYGIAHKKINIISIKNYNSFYSDTHIIVDSKTFINTVYNVLFDILRGEISE